MSIPPVIIRQFRLPVRSRKVQLAAVLMAFAAGGAAAGHRLAISEALLCAGSLTLSWAVLLHRRATHDTPRWAWVRQYRRTPALVRLREEPDAAEGTYRSFRLLRTKTPWYPHTLITRVSVNAFDYGEMLAFGPVTFTYEQLARGHNAHHYG